ncbi:semaphorin-5A isoform X2 [Bacillus rossius redtenbacheri]
MPTADLFSDPETTAYSQLLFDTERDQVVVGARDALYRLSLRGLTLLEKASWPAPGDKAALCQVKGQSEASCHNYVKVLLTNGKRLFACGTNAFSPQCSWRELENVNNVLELVKGVAKCPYNPLANVTALLTRGGQYFVGSPADFSGADPAIYRSMSTGDRATLRTNQYNSKWLNDPQFVGSFERDGFVYFLFRESAVEYINCGKIIYSRIARVCKNDSGGELMLKDNWTTFVKARLNCSLPGEYPFYFDEIQGMAYVPSVDMVYATFTTPSNSIPGSAICAFNMTAINSAFAGPFKHQSSSGSAWEPHHTPRRHHFECQAAAPQSRQLLDSSKYQLMDHAVQPTTLGPLYTGQLETLTHIAVDVMSTNLYSDQHVLYVATTTGFVKKISVLSRTHETCVVEVWKLHSGESPVPINTVQYLKETESVYVGLTEGVLRVPAQHCDRHGSREACLNAMDPYCGWNELKEQCTTAPNRNPLAKYWQQSVTRCPVLTDPVDGGWGSWSSWFPCSHLGPGQTEPGGDECSCRRRHCDNPAPRHGGRPCEGVSVAVANCTVHGGWTAWSAWSACSQTCGMAVKTRRRQCGNPAPAHGGRVCVGPDHSEIYCTTNPPCPALTPPPRDGGWSSWGPWDECSASCGGGYRVRRRRCDNPAPEHGGQDCQGCHTDHETCGAVACPEVRRLSQWTPWLPTNASAGGGGSYLERRYRFSCKAPVGDPALLKIVPVKEEDRYCNADGSCMKTGRGDGEEAWSEWTGWSDCSAECGTGHQHRTRTCEGRRESCEGASSMARSCNTHPCRGEWGCWTDWSSCSATCGQGRRQRTRLCLSVGSRNLLETGCDGSSVQQEPCELASCESLQGWEPWTVWSECDRQDEQHRRRKCLTTNPGPELCQGHDQETRMCVELRDDNEISPLGVQSSLDSSGAGSVSVGVILGSCLVAFLVGVIAGTALWYFYQQRKRPRVPGSPHYISSKQNPYVTVPLKETAAAATTPSAKRAPSGAGGLPGSPHKGSANGGTPKLFAKPLVEYETATIKRNSHGMANGHMRTDLEQDKFF